jgi:phosphinothricin acetyltransferase
MSSAPSIRPSQPEDVAHISAIYAHHVRHGVASFELDPPEVAEMARRRRDVLDAGLPYLVAELDGAVAGFACAGSYRQRPAYRHTVESTVYVADWAVRRGVGRMLLEALIPACEAAGKRQMVAVIGDSANTASIGLHASVGFSRAGTLKHVGYKHGRWLDTVVMQRRLGTGAETPPAD